MDRFFIASTAASIFMLISTPQETLRYSVNLSTSGCCQPANRCGSMNPCLRAWGRPATSQLLQGLAADSSRKHIPENPGYPGGKFMESSKNLLGRDVFHRNDRNSRRSDDIHNMVRTICPQIRIGLFIYVHKFSNQCLQIKT